MTNKNNKVSVTSDQEAEALTAYLSTKSAAYNFDADYKAAQGRLLRIQNPRANYEVARRAAVSRYIRARASRTTLAYRAWARVVALATLAEIKTEFLPLLKQARAA